ncbi:MAG TPA: hypothetical protein VFG69_14375 [Nannocystaceae bacterium]|nr:hypothetical protein [Nannocystaceae bacterium]
MSLRSSSLCLAALALAIAGCSDDGQLKPARVRVGTATTGDVVFGAVVEDTVSVYVCGGDTTFATHTRWFRDAELDDDGSFEMTLDGWTISGSVADDRLAASLESDMGEALELAGEAVAEDGLAGLYTAELDGCTTGLVVRGEGDDVQTQGTWCSDQSQFAQVIVLEPLALTSMGIHVEVMRPDPLGVTDFYVAPF